MSSSRYVLMSFRSVTVERGKTTIMVEVPFAQRRQDVIGSRAKR